MKNRNIKRFLTAAVVVMALTAHGQQSHLEFRFANGVYDKFAKTYSIDIEVFTTKENTALYAMNTRFFFEADELEFESFSDFKKGYGLISTNGKAMKGSLNSAKRMFLLKGAAGYINEGIEIKDVSGSKNWGFGKWEKLTTVNFNVLQAQQPLCPAFIWDKQVNVDKGGFLQGSMGTAASLVTSDVGLDFKCTAAGCNYEDFNWELTSDSPPYGIANKQQCSARIGMLAEEKTVKDEYFLRQNVPNPFMEETSISFILPESQKGTFSIYDIKGVLLHRMTEKYPKGKNTIDLNKDVMLPVGTHMYRMETKQYQSDYMKMIKIQ